MAGQASRRRGVSEAMVGFEAARRAIVDEPAAAAAGPKSKTATSTPGVYKVNGPGTIAASHRSHSQENPA